jgi:phage tail-like protein
MPSPAFRPHLSSHFELAVDGLTHADFSKCTGLSAEIAPEEYPEGGENRFVHRLPSRASYPSIVLSQGAGDTTELWDWWMEYLATGRVAPRDGQVHLLGLVDGEVKPVRAWKFTRSYPLKIAAAELDAAASGAAIETMELAHHGLSIVKLAQS